MQGKLKKLKDNNGQYVFPITHSNGVYVEANKTLTQKLAELGTGGGGGEAPSSASLYPYYQPVGEQDASVAGNRVYRYWTVAELYAAWDALMSANPGYITKTVAPYMNYTQEFDLRRYVFTPEWGYKKTVYIGAGVHGSEYANKLSLLRIFQLITEKWRTNPQLSYMRNYVRYVVIPVINPYGHRESSLVNGNATANTASTTVGVNCNRNYDAFFFQTTPSAGGDHNGANPFSEPETQWVRDTIDWIGAENIHYAFDLHDAPSLFHGDYWINSNTFHKVSKRETKKLLQYLANKNVREALGREPVLDHDKDTNTSGVFPIWAGRTKGIPASTVECCYDMQPFTAAFMTLAVEVYLNAIMVHSLTDDHEHPVIESNQTWFDLEWYKAGVEYVWYSVNHSYDGMLGGSIGKWDSLVTKYPRYVSLGSLVVNNFEGKRMKYYILSPKRYTKTVYIVGGKMEPGFNYQEWSISMLRFAELLCEHAEKDKHLAWIKENVRIVFLPYTEYASTQYLNSYGNFNVAGTPDTTKVPVKNVVDVMTNIGTVNGVIYATEKTGTNAQNSTNDDEFAIHPEDSTDVINLEKYIDYLNDKGLVVAKTATVNTGTGDFTSYVHKVKAIPCVRIDSGLDHDMYNLHKNQFDGSSGEPVVDVSVNDFRKMDSEICRRITHMVNVVKLMTE